MDIKITVGKTVLDAEIYDTELGNKIAEQLPLEARPNRWGDEIYFGLSIVHALQNEQEEVEVGELAFFTARHLQATEASPKPPAR